MCCTTPKVYGDEEPVQHKIAMNEARMLYIGYVLKV